VEPGTAVGRAAREIHALNTLPEAAAKLPDTLQLKPEGQGPDVAGYATTDYSMIAQGIFCGVVSASR
jgi:hypothetical protein